MKYLTELRIGLENRQRGQAMILIALAFVGLVAFIGLAIDAGIVFANIGHLRRGVDSAALSAANQIRQGWDETTITASAQELILLNLPAGSAAALNVTVNSCNTDPGISGCSVTNPRKLARVSASFDVNLAFLPIIGWDSVGISAEAISEAAAVDLLLVLDNSTSMAYDTDGIAEPQVRITPDELDACNLNDTCKPFTFVRSAAKDLVAEMLVNFDKVGIVTFNRFAGKVSGTMGEFDEFPLFEPDLQLTLNQGTVQSVLDNMIVYPNVNQNACNDFDQGDFRGCMATNTALGLKLAGQELLSARARQESVKVIIILSDGVANAAIADSPPYSGDEDDWYCPHDYWRNPATLQRFDGYEGPWCTDGDPTSGYVNPAFGAGMPAEPDPEDMVRAYADWVGCLPPGENTICAGSGVGAVVFAVGLGEYLAELPYNEPVSDVGGQLLRYIARVGFNGDPRFTEDSPCYDVYDDVHATCGNYYFTADGTGVGAIFQDIADRIFTRLTH